METDYYNSAAYVEKKVEGLVDDNQKVQFIRAKWIGLMVEKLSKIFMEQEEALLTGKLEKDLLSCMPEEYKPLIDEINRYSVKYIYNYKSVVEIEIAGYNVIGGLLKEFINAVLHPEKSKSAKIVQLISSQFPVDVKDGLLYNNIQSVVDFISGMTDLYAIDLYRKMTGISIPQLR
jgi:dGTPase